MYNAIYVYSISKYSIADLRLDPSIFNPSDTFFGDFHCCQRPQDVCRVVTGKHSRVRWMQSVCWPKLWNAVRRKQLISPRHITLSFFFCLILLLNDLLSWRTENLSSRRIKSFHIVTSPRRKIEQVPNRHVLHCTWLCNVNWMHRSCVSVNVWFLFFWLTRNDFRLLKHFAKRKQ